MEAIKRFWLAWTLYALGLILMILGNPSECEIKLAGIGVAFITVLTFDAHRRLKKREKSQLMSII